jgi:putative transposase
MVYDPEKHDRRSYRLKGYDYFRTGMYYITICARDRENLLAKFDDNGGAGLAPALNEDAKPLLTRIGKIVDRNWNDLSNHFPDVVLDEYVIMPNHFHGILVIKSGNKEPATLERAPASDAPPLSSGSIIGSFKSRCVTENLRYIEENGLDETGKIWQRNYHDQIIRNELDLQRFRRYIRDNPGNWSKDENNPVTADYYMDGDRKNNV